MEETIGNNLDSLQKKIADASAAMGKASKQDAMERAAEKARDLTRGLESLDQRMRERSQNGRNQNGQNGQQGNQNGQQGNQNGQQGNQNGQQSAQNGQQAGQNGQQGSQDGQNASGANNGGRANDGFTNGSPNRGGAYGGDARNWGYYGGYWNADDIRQWRREYREWANDAEGLRRQLQQNGVSPRELEDIIRDLQKFDNDRVYTDPRGLELLQSAALEKLKNFEFSLRRKVENGNDSLSLSGSDQVPDGFRQAIEEYYRSLSRKAPQPR